VEIGYGTHEEFQNRGFMTEAVSALCAWGFKSGKVKTIIAETAKDNPASFGVVKKNNFVKYDENDEFFYWKLSKNE
jgi:ribosomal-protein-alanine N-acetyltransferase